MNVLVIFFLIWAVLFPIAGIWALNTLFAVGIAYTFETWAAMLVISFLLGSSSFSANKD